MIAKFAGVNCCACAIALLWATALQAAGIGTSFTYQGQLSKNGTAVNDMCDMTFGLWDAASGGNEVGASPQGPILVDVIDGIFSVTLDFGDAAIDGTARWLEISVQCPGDAMATTLAPLVELTPAPHALALPGLFTQENATSPNLIGGYNGNQVTTGVVGATIGGGGRDDDGSGFQNNNLVTDHYGTVGGGRGNLAGDNAGTTGDQQYATVGGGIRNKANGLSFVGGGSENTASGSFATIGGGTSNQAASGFSTIAGGALNDTAGLYATVGGGESNQANGQYSTISGGSVNTASASRATIAGGDHNVAGQIYTFVGGGAFNNALGNYSAVSGGNSNYATGEHSTVGGGVTNTASGTNASVGGGTGNTATGSASAVGGGGNNLASGFASTVPGGQQSVAAGDYSLASGRRAKANHHGSFVWGGATDADFASTAVDQFLIRAPGGVGIGTDSPMRPLHVAGDAQVDGTMWASTLSSNSPLALQTAGTTRIFADDVTGNVGIGTLAPSESLHVAGNAQVDGTTLTSVVKGGSSLDLKTSGGSRVFLDDATGRVGIGTVAPDKLLQVAGDAKVDGTMWASTVSSNSPLALQTAGTTRIFADDVTGFVGVGTTTPGTVLDVVSSTGIAMRADSAAGTGVHGRGTTYGGYFENTGSSGTRYGAYCFGNNFGVFGSGGGSGYGVYGTAGFAGIYGSGFTHGVYGFSPNYGLLGDTGSTTGGVGVWGRTVGTGGTAYAVYGQPNAGQPHWAGYFAGAVHVAGTLSKAAGAFKIDHPLDPENKFLSHSFVESPDMKNIYDGTVNLDTRGEAWITLPSYFQALNKDFRYQLTAVGGAAPNLHVAVEVTDNRFKIAGGPANGRVSWQVTGIRHDPYAEANRIKVEEDKKADERGKYLVPDVYGQPAEKMLHRLEQNQDQAAAAHPAGHPLRAEGGRQ